MSDGIKLFICASLHIVFLLSWYLTECKLTLENWFFILLLPLDHILVNQVGQDTINVWQNRYCNRYSDTKCILVLVPFFMVPKLPNLKFMYISMHILLWTLPNLVPFSNFHSGIIHSIKTQFLITLTYIYLMTIQYRLYT